MSAILFLLSPLLLLLLCELGVVRDFLLAGGGSASSSSRPTNPFLNAYNDHATRIERLKYRFGDVLMVYEAYIHCNQNIFISN